jgi:hypothetical protein
MQYGIKWKYLPNKNSINTRDISKWRSLFIEETSKGYLLLCHLSYVCGKVTPAPERQSNWVHKM